jgi:UDP-2,4-diacetamido-2,4,6-trideoxy-beta-L-altropyranose hydrolase
VRVAIRTDASRAIGSGHLARMLTLADALAAVGATVEFVCRAHGDGLESQVVARGHALRVLAGARTLPAGEVAHRAWLGAGQDEDAQQTLAALGAPGARCDWLVVDHYGIDAAWQALVRPAAGRLLVVDDLADRTLDCDLLLDQNLLPDMDTRYRGRVPPGAALLLGPRYALLHPEFARLRAAVVPRTGPVRRILASFGGVDAADLAARTVRAFRSLGLAGVALDVAVGAGYAHVDALRALVGGGADVCLHVATPRIGPLMAAAQLAVGAAGSTTWERMCLGLPTIVVAVADNQRPIARALAEQQLALVLEGGADVTEAELAAAIGRCVIAGADATLARRGFALVDGQGAARVAALMRERADSA